MSKSQEAIRAIYEAAKPKGTVSATDTAKLIRHRMKGAFPDHKFRVKTSKYAGGASIHIVSHGGPSAADVYAIVNPYQGRQFDAVIDLSTPITAYLTPDGVAHHAENPGTIRNAGDIPPSRAFKPTPDAIRVQFAISTILYIQKEVA